MKLIDISPLIDEKLAVWPGDVPYQRSISCAIAEGANIDLSAIQTTLHLGAHVDAPSHYSAQGESIEQRSLNRYYGECQVIDVAVGPGERIGPHHLTEDITAERVLLRTLTYPNPRRFNEDFAALSAHTVTYLHKQGVKLVGIDTPSIDLMHDKALEAHTLVASYDMAILEGVDLSNVLPGQYTLCAFPLKLRDADASPVRAVLIQE